MNPQQQRAAFLAAIAADPADRTARDVFADWLDEQGEGLAAGAFRAAAVSPQLAEIVCGSIGRRSFYLTLPRGLDVMQALAVGHAMGIPRPGDEHPLYATTVIDLAAHPAGPLALAVCCEYA